MEGADLAQRRIVVAANRGPVSFHDDPSGEPVVARGPGGLVTVLTEVLRHHPGTWVAAALSDAERRLAAEQRAVEVALDGEEYRVRYVAPSPEAYHKYYNIVANPMLWFIQHYLWDLGRHPDIGANELDAWYNGYLVVNELFAKAVADEVGRRAGAALVLLHDYQLYCVARDVRDACPGTFLQQFVHIPWPQSDYWRVLPTPIREAVFRGLLGNDIVAFHTRHYVSNFLRCCADLLDLEVDETRGVVRHDGREVWARAYPVSIDPASLRDAADSARAHDAERELRSRRREFLLLRVDRLDLSKNIIRGFHALDRFLELHPEFKERLTFLALLQPSREDVEEYVTYRERVERIVADVNTHHGTTDWMPIDLRIQDDFPITLAAYAQYDVLLVNAISDGMNLVAKEGPILNRHDGVLVLSEYAGAYEELGAFALGVNPFDIEGQAEALHRALTM
ncbi:MAG TPA: trehalose-6-phosphate synthase, partial [Thermoleophilia bacterium]|nr:trehalose-6-phosphate synthase [Thermoleophilia bacterium]